MVPRLDSTPRDWSALAADAARRGDWQAAAEAYAALAEERSAELALINAVQAGLSARLDQQAIYDLIGDMLRDTFNAQVVMISQYDPATRRVFHHYAIERGQHLHIPGWQPLDSSRGEVIHTRKPFMINAAEILRVVQAAKMTVVPGTELPKTWLGVPMLINDVAVGIVSLQNLDIENAFSPTDINLLVTLTNSMSQSLENARLFKETERLLEQIEDELSIARRTQRSILPARMPRRPGYDFGALMNPARSVGGDFYDFLNLDGERLGLVIGDVSDKGLPASLFMALTFSLLRAEAGRKGDPRQVLLNVNRGLRKMNASGMFVTLVYGVLHAPSGGLRYARAGHLVPLVLDAQGRAPELPHGLGQSLGLFSDVTLDEQRVELPPGGLALLFSDGLNEAIDAQGEEFGYERIRAVLRAHRDESARAICKRLWDAVRAHSGDQPAQDDFTAVVVKRLAE